MGAAIAAGVEVLVTGDKELLDLARVRTRDSLSPAVLGKTEGPTKVWSRTQ